MWVGPSTAQEVGLFNINNSYRLKYWLTKCTRTVMHSVKAAV